MQNHWLEKQRREHWQSLTLWQKIKFRSGQVAVCLLAAAVLIGCYMLNTFRWGF